MSDESKVTMEARGNGEQNIKEKLTDSEDFDADKAILEKIEALRSAIGDKYVNAMVGLEEIKWGSGYQKADSGLLDYAGSLNDLVLYGSKTSKLYKKGKTSDGAANAGVDNSTEFEVRESVNAIIKMLGLVNEFSGSVLDMLNKKVFQLAYAMIRLDKELPSLSDRYGTIIHGFNEYNTLRVRYGNAEIIRELRLRKDATPEKNYEIAKINLDAYISETKHLKTLLSSGGTNDLFVLDRLTCAFHHIYAAKDDMKGWLDGIRNLLVDCDKLAARNDMVWLKSDLLYVHNCITSIAEVFETALKLIDDYANEASKPPYAFMHYDFVVKDVADRWLGESLPDPVTNGTRYSDLIRSVNKSWDSVLRPIAKNAAKWGWD